MITNAIEVLDSSSTKQDDTVLLKRMAFVGDVGNYLVACGKPDLSHFADGGIGLLGGPGGNLHANTSAKRASLESR